MLKIIVHIFIVFVLVIISSCSDKNSPISTVPNFKITVDSTEIFHYSFEENGIETLAGWNYEDSLVLNSISFLNDAPTNEGNWSLKIITNPSTFKYLTYVLKPQKTDF